MKCIFSIVLVLITVATCMDLMGKKFKANQASEDCVNSSFGDKVADTADCTKYYICTGNGTMSDDSFDCPASYLCFSPEIKDCTSNSTVCDDVCPKPSECKTVCTAKLDQLADMKKCERHYLCLEAGENAETVLIDCPEDLPYFDGGKCVAEKSRCCNCQREDCDDNRGKLIANPQDCHSYYYCEPVGNSTHVLGPFTCEGGGSFDSDSKACDPSTTVCDPICDLDF